MLKKFFTPEIMADNYKLSKLPTYYAPPDGSYDATVKYIKSLPLDEDPEVFGLHSNANITFETNLVN
jgi:dynein heavy chain